MRTAVVIALVVVSLAIAAIAAPVAVSLRRSQARSILRLRGSIRPIGALRVGVVRAGHGLGVPMEELQLVGLGDLTREDLKQPFFPTVVLEQPVGEWADFLGIDYRYFVDAPGDGELRIFIYAYRLRRSDPGFVFRFTLANIAERNWLALVCAAKCMWVVNGAGASLNRAAAFDIDDSQVVARMEAALELPRSVS